MFFTQLTSFVLFAYFFHCVEGLSGSKHCAACRAILNDVEWAIKQVDPKKKLKVGNFRVNTDGSVNARERSFARSETHLTEVFESICEKMTDYSEMTEEDGSKQIVRTTSHDGKMLRTRHVNLDRDIGSTLKSRCMDFLEDNEDEVIALLQREDISNYEQAICVEETGACTEEEVAKPLTVLPEVTFNTEPIQHGKEAPADDDEEEEEEDEGEGEEESENNEDDGERIEFAEGRDEL